MRREITFFKGRILALAGLASSFFEWLVQRKDPVRDAYLDSSG